MNRLLLCGALLVGTAGPVLGQQRLYLANQDDATVSIVDLATNTVVETVDLQALGFGANAKPHHAQVEPDGSFWYLTLIGGGKVLKFDRQNRIVGSVDQEVPGLMALDPAHDLLVVGHSMSAVNPPRRIALIRRSDMTLLDEIDIFFPRPHALALSPDGSHVFVASLGVNQFASVRLADGKVQLVDVDGPPHTLTQFSVSPDGHWLVATAETSGQLLVFDIRQPDAPRLAHSVATPGPFETAFSWDGRWLWATNLNANTVSVVDVSDWTVSRVITDERFSKPHGVMPGPDGRFMYVSNRSQAGGAHDHEGQKATAHGVLAVICQPTRMVESVLTVGNYAAGIGVAAPASRPGTPASCR